MGFWPRKIVCWTEPEAFRFAEDKYWSARTPFWKRPLYVTILTAVFIIGWVFAYLDPEEHAARFAIAFPLFASLSLFLIYTLPWLLRLAPSTVTLYDRAIMKAGHEGMISLKSFTCFAWITKESYQLVELTNKKGRKLHLGLSDPTLRTKIDAVLRQNGLTEIQAE